MLNVIICDDNTMDLNKIVKIVEKFMNSNNLSYKKYIFTDYDNNFLKIVDSKMPFKIFILDIEVPSRSGIDIARLIRKKDISSPIIFLTGHNELGMELLMEDIPFTAFISKFIKCEIRIKKCLVNSINEMNKYRVLKLRDSSISCRIKYDNILLILWNFSIIFGWKFIFLFSISVVIAFKDKYSELDLYDFTDLKELEEYVNGDNFFKGFVTSTANNLAMIATSCKIVSTYNIEIKFTIENWEV